MEYPHYGVYKHKKSLTQILRDSEDLYQFMIKNLRINANRIIVMGWSLGTGPATYLASKYQIAGLILMSPFSSLKDLAKDIVGRLLSVLVRDKYSI